MGGDGPRASTAAAPRRWGPDAGQGVPGRAPGGGPLCLTDGVQEYAPALLTHCGQGVQPPRRPDKGPVPKPRWRPQPGLLSAQGLKTVRRRRLVLVSQRGLCGTREAVQQVLAAPGWHRNTALGERLNRTIPQHGAAVGRRVATLGPGEDGGRQPRAVYHGSYKFCLPPTRVRQPLPQPRRPNGSGAAQQGQPWPPALAAGLTDRVGPRREVRRFRVPPWPQPGQG